MAPAPEQSLEFLDAVEFVLAREGGYNNDPDDPGKATNLGISQRSYPNEDIANMERSRAIFLYHRDFWIGDPPNRCEEMPRDVALPLFDFAVNAPAWAARRCLQRVVGAKPDGKLGPKSMAAIDKAVQRRGERAIGLDLIDHRLQRYVRRVQQGRSPAKFLLGWMRRLQNLTIELYEGDQDA